ncbi:MAG: helix-turn-helix transcriptional regulator, partial [Firmicutes bacterium]|nr:helix-turn-helix transcriptional regulator [Bacillota bacterium]
MKKDELRKKISALLAEERYGAEVSQKELAQRLGTQKSNISRIEQGRQNISVDYVQAIADALNISVSFVVSDNISQYGDTGVYILKLYDEELLKFRLTRGTALACELLWVKEDRKQVFPLDLQVSGQGMIEWLKARIIPQNRELVGSILNSLGLNINDVKGIVDVCMGLSLNDSYWITREDFAGTFGEYNLYENRFTEALSLIAYTGGRYSTRGFRTSPELTTGVMLRKAWRFLDEDVIWLYKSGTD